MCSQSDDPSMHDTPYVGIETLDDPSLRPPAGVASGHAEPIKPPQHVYECWVPRPGGICRGGCSCWCHQGVVDAQD